MFYIFCDEKYRDFDGFRRFITGYLAVPQNSWNHTIPDRRGLKIPHNISLVARLEKLLVDTGGVALLAYADLSLNLLPKEKRDGTDDVPGMARTDNAWSAALLTGLTTILTILDCKGHQVQAVDTYYDTRNLKIEHLSAIKNTVTQNLIKIINEARQRLSFQPPEFRPKIRCFNPVLKAVSGKNPDKYQAGVLVVHKLLKNDIDLIDSGSNKGIYVSDNTQFVEIILRTF